MDEIDDLLGFIAASPSPYHVVATAVDRLERAGFRRLDPAAPWPEDDSFRFIADGGALIAWGATEWIEEGLRIVGAHTDSPNLRIKPRPERSRFGWHQLGVEVYGGALWNSWLDRDLGISGRVHLRDEPTSRLLLVDEPLARVPQLAIHLDRDVNTGGLRLNAQEHLTPVWATGSTAPSLTGFLAERLDIDAEAIYAWDLMFHDLTAPAVIGLDRSMVAAPRLDDQLSCWAAVAALADSALHAAPPRRVPMICLFDHEEVGSASATGASGPLLERTIGRICARRGGPDLQARVLEGSFCMSADGAHATHPNHPERHEPEHRITIDGGPVVKVNANQRYATDASGAAAVIALCEAAGIPHQSFVSRNDVPCGSTIGPLASTRLGIRTADVGVAQLSMHSAREMCGVEDPIRFGRLLNRFFYGRD